MHWPTADGDWGNSPKKPRIRIMYMYTYNGLLTHVHKTHKYMLQY